MNDVGYLDGFDELNLAWDVVSVLSAHLADAPRAALFVTLGAGDARTALRDALGAAMESGVELPVDLEQRCRAWAAIARAGSLNCTT